MPWWFWLLVFTLGACFGSFINCWIWRLRHKKTMLGRSMCPLCHHQLAWYDNIPLLSFISLRGACRYCHKPISWQYPAVEFIVAFLFVLVFRHHFLAFLPMERFLWLVVRDWFLILALVIIFIYDFRWYLIPDVISLPAATITFFFNLYLGYPLSNLLLAGAIGAGFFLTQFLISGGTWIGGGDIRVGLLLGFIFVDWRLLVLTIFLAYIMGSIVGLTLIFSGRKKWGSKLPLGVFLSAAAIISLLWGQQILFFYQSRILGF